MPRLIVNEWGVVVDFTWGVVDGIVDASKNNTNSTTSSSSNLETKIISICNGGAVVYSSKFFLKNLIMGASPNLLIKLKDFVFISLSLALKFLSFILSSFRLNFSPVQ